MAKYGLSLDDWKMLAHRQGYVCAVCRKLPRSGRLHIDHEHIRGWKKLEPDLRKLFVRGLLCHWCNRSFAARGMTAAKADNLAAYLKLDKLFALPM
jgi:hypothetical protein